MKKFSVSLILAGLYIVYAWFSIASLSTTPESAAEAIGTSIGAAIVLPHLIVATIGFVLHILGAKDSKRAYIITAAILYTVAIVIFIFWAFLLIPGMIATWVAIKKIPKKKKG